MRLILFNLGADHVILNAFNDGDSMCASIVTARELWFSSWTHYTIVSLEISMAGMRVARAKRRNSH